MTIKLTLQIRKKSERVFSVIPAEAGIPGIPPLLDPGACPGPDPGLAGVTAKEAYYEPDNFSDSAKKVYYFPGFFSA